MNKYLYPIKNLKTKSYIKWWLYRYLSKNKANYILSEILEGTFFTLEDSSSKKFNLFQIIGNTTQDSTTGKQAIMSLYEKSLNSITWSFDKNKAVSSMVFSGIVSVGVNSAAVYIQTSEGTIRLPAYLTESANTKFTYNATLSETILTNIANSTFNPRISIYKSGVDFSNTTYSEMMLRDSTTTDTYEPYTGGIPAPSPSFPFPINNTGDNGSINEKVSNSDGTKEQNISFPLAEGQKFYDGDYLADDGIHHIENMIDLSSLSWELVNTSSETGISTYRVSLTDRKPGNNFIPPKCTHFSYLGTIAGAISMYSRGVGIVYYYNVDYPTITNIYLNSTIATVAELKTWMTNNNVKLQYELENEVIDPYTLEQAEAWEQIKALRTYKPVTHISSEDELPANLKIQYWKEG